MLTSLHIENIAIIKTMDINFAGGFVVLSGETGAGKSIIVDSVGLLLGAKSSREQIREGESKAFVSAAFSVADEKIIAAARELGADCDDGELILQREISADGKSSARVNGRPVTVSALKSIAARLINIHGQHDTTALLRPES